MSEQTQHITRTSLRSPRSAAIAGIIFAVLLIAFSVLMQLTLPADPADINGEWLEEYAAAASIALGFLTVAGIAFLWFMGVARDLLGHLEDQFLSTVSLGSGLLFLAMIFVWAAVGSAILVSYARDGADFAGSGIYRFGRTLMVQLSGIYAMRMAGVYVFSSGTTWFRTGVMPRWLAIITWGVALLLWIAAGFFWWVQLAFPAWVFLVSIYILLVSPRNQPIE
jgi:hypothetical protein